MLFLVVSQIINGVVTGMIYALVGVGLTLILGVLNIPNFAHGVLFAFGAYIMLSVLQVVGNFWLALLIAPFGVVLLGLLLELVGGRRLFKAPHH